MGSFIPIESGADVVKLYDDAEPFIDRLVLGLKMLPGRWFTDLAGPDHILKMASGNRLDTSNVVDSTGTSLRQHICTLGFAAAPSYDGDTTLTWHCQQCQVKFFKKGSMCTHCYDR